MTQENQPGGGMQPERRRRTDYQNQQMNAPVSRVTDSWPFEEPEQSPELRQERSPDLYRATNPFWNRPLRDASAQSGAYPPQPVPPGAYQTPQQSVPTGAYQTPQQSVPPGAYQTPQQSVPPEAYQRPPTQQTACQPPIGHPDVLDTDSYTGEIPRGRSRRTRRLLTFLVAAAVMLIVASLLFGALFRVRHIQVSGNVNISAEEIIALSQIQIGQSSLLDEEAIKNHIQQNPYLVFVMLEHPSCDTIILTVKERQETACLTSGGIGIIIDARGYVLRTYANPKTEQPGLVQVQGMSAKYVMVGQKLVPMQQQQLDAVTEILLKLKIMGGLDQIAVLDISTLDRITMQTTDEMEIVLGDDELLHEKLRAFLLVRQELENRGKTGGTLTLSNPVEPVYAPPEVSEAS